MTSERLREKAALFDKLHTDPELLVLQNAWDVASAAVIAAAGAKAIATGSAGVAFVLGYADGERISRDEMLGMGRRIAAKLDLPVTVDLEAGYGGNPEAVAETVLGAIAAGIVGANIEDAPPDRAAPLFDRALAAERIAAGAGAADAAGIPFVLNARTDVYLRGGSGKEAFDEAVARLNAYRAAGARSLFAPGVRDEALIGDLVKAVDGPLNILVGAGSPPLDRLRELGVARVSTGPNLALAALGLARRGAEELFAKGTYRFTEGAIPFPDMNKLLAD